MRPFFIVLTAFLSLLSVNSYAEIIWNFEILNPVNTINQNESIDIYGKLENSSTSTSSLSLPLACQGCLIPATSAIGGAGYDKLTSVFSFNNDQYYNSLYGLTLQPGQSFTFLFYSLTPLTQQTPVGSYEISNNVLSLTPYDTNVDAGPVLINVVPLPSSFVEFITGLISLTTFLFRKIAP